MKNDDVFSKDEGECITEAEAYAAEAEECTAVASIAEAEACISEQEACITGAYAAEAEAYAAGNEKLWTAPYITLISLGVFISISFYMVMPLLTKYALQRGASVITAGIIVGMFSITALFARPVSGLISDRLNKKHVFITATALIGFALIGYGISTGIASLVVFRFIQAVAFSVNGTVNLALVAQTVPRKRMGEGIGYFGLGHIIATAAGPAVGLYIGERYGLSAVFLIAGAVMLAASAAMFVLLNTVQESLLTVQKGLDTGQREPYVGQKEPYSELNEPYAGRKEPYSGYKEHYSRQEETYAGQEEPCVGHTEPCTGAKARAAGPAIRIADSAMRTGGPATRIIGPGTRITDFIAVRVLPLAFFGSVFSMFNGVIGSYLVLLGDERGIGNISLYFTVNAIALILVRVAAGRIYDRYGISAVLIPAFIMAAASALFIGFARALPLILAAAVIKAFAQGSAQPSIQAECIRLLPDDKSGVATSTFYIGADIGQGFGPMLAGLIASIWNFEVMFTACAGVYLAALLIYCISLSVNGQEIRHKRHESENQSET